jgi:hypothetical protein
MQPAHRRRRRQFVAAVVAAATGQILGVFEDRDARQLRAWIQQMPCQLARSDRGGVGRPHEGYRSGALTPGPRPKQRTC